MTMEELIKKLKERPKGVDERREQQLTEWKRALEDLVAQVEGWLEPAVRAGVLTVSRSTTEVSEDDFGSYMAPVLRISDGRVTITLEPVGARVVGVVGTGEHRLVGLRGRLDLLCGPHRIPIVRTEPGVWKAVPLRGAPIELSQETVAELISALLLDE